MFKSRIVRRSERALLLFQQHMEKPHSNHGRVFPMLISCLRPKIKESEMYFKNKSPDLEVALNRLLLTREKEDAKQFANDLRRAGESRKIGQFQDDDRVSIVLVSALFELASAIDDPRSCVEAGIFGKPNSEFEVFDDIVNTLLSFFSGNEGALLSDETFSVIEAAIENMT